MKYLKISAIIMLSLLAGIGKAQCYYQFETKAKATDAFQFKSGRQHDLIYYDEHLAYYSDSRDGIESAKFLKNLSAACAYLKFKFKTPAADCRIQVIRFAKKDGMNDFRLTCESFGAGKVVVQPIPNAGDEELLANFIAGIITLRALDKGKTSDTHWQVAMQADAEKALREVLAAVKSDNLSCNAIKKYKAKA